MVMTQQPPANRRAFKNSSSGEEDYWNSSSTPLGGWDSARRRSSPPRVAAAAARKQEEGLSLYEELLRYHRENPDDEDKLKVEEKGGEDDERKPAARPVNGDDSESQARPHKGTYRVPVSREYFAAKDREGFNSPISPGGKPHLTAGSPGQQSIPSLEALDGAPLMSYNRSRTNYPSDFPEEMPLPYLDYSYHDSAEDEALARQLQAEEEERVAAFRQNVGSTGSMPPLSPMTPSHRSSTEASEEALMRHLSDLTTAPSVAVYPSALVPDSPLSAALPPTDRTTRHSPVVVRAPQVVHLPGAVSAEDDLSQQETILREIMEENEKKQLAWALQESKKEAAQPARARVRPVLPGEEGPAISDLPSPPSPTPRRRQASPSRSRQPPKQEWEARQRAALEEFQRQHRSRQYHREALYEHQHHTTGHIDLPPSAEGHHAYPEMERTRSSRSAFSRETSRESALQRGREETSNAIRSGQARIVRCHGCAGRLQAPRQYSRVYCPKCGHISPVES